MSSVRDVLTDQPLPKSSDGPVIHDLVVEDLKARLAFGVAKYNEPLRAFNGRDAMQDAYEEELDKIVYMKQVQLEWEAFRKLYDLLLEESSWNSSVFQDIVIELSERPDDWSAIAKHWPKLAELVESLIKD